MIRFLPTLLLAAAACSDAACEDLAAVCELCPDTPDGRQARTSCLGVVASDDSVTCEDNLESGVFGRHGCQ
jgi:hypothetical protein